MERMEVNDVEENPLSMCENQAETTFTSPDQPRVDARQIKLMGTLIDIESPGIESVGSTSEQCECAGDDQAAAPTTLMINEGASRAAYSQRYKDLMDALSKPDSSYSLLYGHEPFVAPSPKTPPKKETKKSTEKSEPKIRTEKIFTKEAEYKSFPQNVRTLTATGMLDGVQVRYCSASSKVIPSLIMFILHVHVMYVYSSILFVLWCPSEGASRIDQRH